MKSISLKTLTIFFLSILFLSSCGGGGGGSSSSGNGGRNDAEIVDNAILIQDNQITTDIMTINSTSLIITAASTINIQKNDIIVMDVNSKAEYGLLKKVKSISTDSSGNQVLKIEQAELTDIIKKGSIASSGVLIVEDTPQANNLNTFNQGIRLLSAIDSRSVNGENCQSTNPDFVVNIANVNTPNGLTVDGCIGLSVNFDLKIDIEDNSLQRAYIVVNPKENRAISLTANNYMGNSNISLEYSLYTQKFKPITFFIGIVPIVIVPEIQIVIGINGQVTTTFYISGSGDSSVKVGAEYTPSTGWTSIYQVDNSLNFSPPYINTSAQVEVFVGPELGFLFYGVVGPEVYLNGYISIEADANTNPWWTLYGGIKAGIEVEFSLTEKLAWSANFPDLINERIILTQAEEAFTVPIAPTNLTAQAGNKEITFTWNSVNNATSYNIYWSTISGQAKNGTKISGVTSPYTQTNLTNNTTYYYTVTSNNSKGESEVSSEVNVTPSESTIFFQEDYESYSVGSLPSDYTIVHNGQGNSEQRVEEKNGNKYLRTAGARSWSLHMRKDFTEDVPSQIVVTWKMKMSNDITTYISNNDELGEIGVLADFYIKNATESSASIIIWKAKVDGKFYFACNGSMQKIQTNIGDWYNYRLEIDFKKGTYISYLGNTPICSDNTGTVDLSGTWNSFSEDAAVRFGSGNSGSTETLFDDITILKIE